MKKQSICDSPKWEGTWRQENWIYIVDFEQENEESFLTESKEDKEINWHRIGTKDEWKTKDDRCWNGYRNGAK